MVVEKHFTLDKNLPGPDHGFSVNPEELMQLVESVRLTEKMLGSDNKEVRPVEGYLRTFAKRALHTTKDIDKDDILTCGDNFQVLRSGYQTPGVHPKYLDRFEGKRVIHHVLKGAGLQFDDIEWDKRV